MYNLNHTETRMYSSKDVAAPALSGSPGDIKTILKACLAIGYGNKLPAGWIIEAEGLDDNNKNKICLRPNNPEASELAFVFDDSISNSDISTPCTVKAVVDFVDFDNVDDVLHVMPTIPIMTNTNGITLSAIPRKAGDWVLIAHDASCLLLLSEKNQAIYTPVFFGATYPATNERSVVSVVIGLANSAYGYSDIEYYLNINDGLTRAPGSSSQLGLYIEITANTHKTRVNFGDYFANYASNRDPIDFFDMIVRSDNMVHGIVPFIKQPTCFKIEPPLMRQLSELTYIVPLSGRDYSRYVYDCMILDLT